ncbi:hypothetical protein [Spiroplasma endosymbiont of Ammophila pubescens]|uniref:hypothetical protein n=1 Tax=Spiroplasma endosymbiont of Ammophila pubescens TaxID=3066315 RepID=UPI0032B10A00
MQLSFENKIDLIKLTVDSSTTKNISLKDMAKIIAIDKNDISGYRIDKDEKPLFTKFKSINTIRHFLNKNNIDIFWIKFNNKEKLDEIIYVITIYQSYDTRKKELKKLNYQFLTDNII